MVISYPSSCLMKASSLVLVVSLLSHGCRGQLFSWNNRSLYRPLNSQKIDLDSIIRQGVQSGGLPVEQLQRRFPTPSAPTQLGGKFPGIPQSFFVGRLPVEQLQRRFPTPSAPTQLGGKFPGIPQSFFVEADKRLAQTANDIDEPVSSVSTSNTKDVSLDQVSNLARHLLNLPVANQQQLLSAVSSALGGQQPPPADPFGPSAANEPLLPVELFHSTAASPTQPPIFNPELQLQQLPTEQRNLLQAAIRSGELSSDPKQLWPAINSVLSEHRATTATLPSNAIDAYLQQYSKRTGANPADWLNLPQNILPKGIFEQLDSQSAPALNFVPPTPLAPEKLPYYGKYCGSFTENRDVTSTRHYNVQGAVWIIDEQHLLVSKFVFQPAFFQKENITFWVGPNENTGDAVEDMFPSGNGIFLRPEAVDLKPFLTSEKKTQIAKQPSADQVSKIFNRESKNKSSDAEGQSSNDHGPHAEPEPKSEPGGATDSIEKLDKATPETGLQVDPTSPQPEPEPVPTAEPRYIGLQVATTPPRPVPEPVPSAEPRRFKRDFFPPRWPSNSEDLFDNRQHSFSQQSANSGAQFNSDNPNNQPLPNEASRTVQLIVDGGMVTVASSDLFNGDQSFNGENTVFLPTLPTHLRPTSTLVTASSTEELTSTATSTVTSTTTAPPTITSTTAAKVDESTTSLSATTDTELVKILEQKDEEYPPLIWYAGYQPLLLKIPDNKRVSDLHWLSIWDHDKDQAIASVLIPNGPNFKVPSPVTLRGLKSNGLRKVSSGPIEIVNTKTIKINEFFYEGDAPGAWFMVGKDLLPNNAGEIVPIYEEQNGTYDCDFLKPYNTQTVILKLPGDMEIKDVFWLSVFCEPFSISFAQVYLPYNDIHVPPDMTGALLRAGNADKMKRCEQPPSPRPRPKRLHKEYLDSGTLAFGRSVFRAAVCRVNGSSSCALGAIQSCAYCPMSIGLRRSVGG
uniref:DM13 domain-containing protein n=1 Tax=Plectus sambesii TaxID=2011161 RepID=A0A914UTY4_9BILA